MVYESGMLLPADYLPEEYVQPFRAGSDEFHSSVALDASTVDGITVTVGVEMTRSEELELLDTLCASVDDEVFKPFYDKSNSLDRSTDSTFVEDLLAGWQDHTVAYSHFHEGNAQTQQVEAVHGAIIVDDIYSSGEEPLVLVDGGENKAKPFLLASAGLWPSLPPTAHCVQAELYYPAALLADLTANFVAARMADDAYDYSSPLLRAPSAEHVRSDKWGQAYSSFYSADLSYDPVPLPHRRGETVKERICCWFNGAVAPGEAPPPDTDSISPVINYARTNGFTSIAATLSEL